MGFRAFLLSTLFVRGVLVFWIVSVAFVGFLLYRVDLIVHGDLYRFGLLFSLDWANPYWVMMRLVYVLLAVPSVLSVAVLVASFEKRSDDVRVVSDVQEAKPIGGKVQLLKENHMVISCPGCKRVFSKPLVMLDFSHGKTRLVNVCPYCNHTLGSAEEEDSGVIPVADLNKKTTR